MQSSICRKTEHATKPVTEVKHPYAFPLDVRKEIDPAYLEKLHLRDSL